MSGTPRLFDDLIGQEPAARFLAAAVEQGPSHAYLFLGPPGSGRMQAALAMAAALCCEAGGCGACASCEKAAQGNHPDIEIVAPTGGQLQIDQIREMNHSLSLHPHESRARVFIISDAEAFNDASANAFLKSLEEPPSFVYFILLAGRADRVLPTVVSRCQEVRFGAVPAQDIEQELRSRYEVSATMAQAFARASRGNLDLARALCTDSGLAAQRDRYLQIGAGMTRGAWEGGAQQMAAEIMAAAAQAGEDAGAVEAPPEGFQTATKKKLEQDAHRRASAAKRRELIMALDYLQSWFRDLLVMASGAGEAITNRDYELEIEQQALESQARAYRRAVEVIEATRAKLGYNIDMELALQAMFVHLQEVL